MQRPILVDVKKGKMMAANISVRTRVTRGAIIPALILLFFVVDAGLNYPGAYLVDSKDQLDQALSGQINDWHPPMMAVFWSFLIRLSGTPDSLFLFQAGLFWSALGIIADGVARSGRFKTALLVLMAGFFPLFHYVNGLLTKDTQMSAAFLAVFAILFWFHVQRRKLPLVAAILAGVLLTYGVLVRANSIFAIGPLVIYWYSRQKRLRYTTLALISVVAATIAMATSSLVNQKLLRANATAPVRSVQIFDIVGIASTSGDMRWLQRLLPISAEELAGCYTPYWWDSVAPWGKCGFIAGTVMNREFKPITSDRDIYPASAELTRLWCNSIGHHPLAYAKHRVKHFNAELNFLVPALVRRFGINSYVQWPDLKKFPDKLEYEKKREVRQDYWRKNFLFWPATWLTVSFALLAALRNAGTTPTSYAGRLLCASGVSYALAYLVVGVASEMRYMYWMILAAVISSILCWDDVLLKLRRRDAPTIFFIAAIPVVVAGGLIFRILDIDSLVR